MTAQTGSVVGSKQVRADRLVRYLSAVCLLIAAASVLGSWLPDAPAALDLAAHFLVQSLLLSGSVFLIGLAGGRPRATVVAAVLMLGAGLILIPAAWPTLGGAFDRASGDATVPAIPPLTVYFHNTWSSNPRTEATVAAARASGADVLLFAETSTWRWREFAPLLEEYPYAIPCADRDECDLTLFSRTPIRDATIFHDRPSGARAIAATVGDRNHGRVRLVAVHLARPIPPDDLDLQMRQAGAILQSGIFQSGLPILLMGDFNAVPWGRIIGKFATQLHLRRSGGIEGTWPDFAPLPLRVRIDQALVSPTIAVEAQHITPGHGSDHRALTITIGPEG